MVKTLVYLTKNHFLCICQGSNLALLTPRVLRPFLLWFRKEQLSNPAMFLLKVEKKEKILQELLC